MLENLREEKEVRNSGNSGDENCDMPVFHYVGKAPKKLPSLEAKLPLESETLSKAPIRPMMSVVYRAVAFPTVVPSEELPVVSL
jgi:hypothetical protein